MAIATCAAGQPVPTYTPSRAAPCRVQCGGSSKPKNRKLPAPKPCRLGRGKCQNSGRGSGRARFQGSKPERPCAAFWQAAQGRRTSSLVRGKSSKPISASARSANDIPNTPRHNGRGLWAYAPACCRRLHESVPSSTLAVRRLYVTKDGSPTRHPALQSSFHATSQARGHLLRQGRFHLVVGRCPCPCQRASR